MCSYLFTVPGDLTLSPDTVSLVLYRHTVEALVSQGLPSNLIQPAQCLKGNERDVVWVLQGHIGDLCESLEQNSVLHCPCFVLYPLGYTCVSQHKPKTGKRKFGIFTTISVDVALCQTQEFHLPEAVYTLLFLFQLNRGNGLEISSRVRIFFKSHA